MLSKVNRYREIFTICAKYEIASWLGKLNLDFAKDIFDKKFGKDLTQFTSAQRVRMAITELGPTFIKLGQILSTRPDLISSELAEELQHLQSNVPSDPPQIVKQIIHDEFGQSVTDLFATFDLKALASASIGQVHLAQLKSGENVVVKVQHANIEEKIRLDLEILLDLADLAERYVEESRNYRPRDTCEEFKRLLLRELDFNREKRNLEKFASNFKDDTRIYIPKAFGDYCTSKVLTMEKLDGIPLSQKDMLVEQGYNVKELAEVGADMFLRMIFVHGFYHADPHPGNLFAMSNNRIGIIDCGMVGLLTDELREDIEDMLMCLVRNNGPKLTNLIIRLGSVPRDLNRAQLQSDVKEFSEYYGTMNLKDINLQKALEEMSDLIRRHKIVLPAGVSLLIKVLVMLEGTSHNLSADFNLISIIAPYRNQMIARRLSPARQKRIMENLMMDWERVAKTVPMGIVDIVERLQSGDVNVKFEHKRLEDSVNRLVMGLVISALFLGSSFLLALKSPPLIHDISITGIVGYIISIAMGSALLFRIYMDKYRIK